MKSLKMLGAIGLTLLVMGSLSACSGSKPYDAPQKVTGSDSAQDEVAAPAVTEFNVGDTATDHEINVSVESVRFADTIDEKGNQFMVANAPEGKEFVIVDLVVENMLADKTQNVSSLTQMQVQDQDGYSYTPDFEALTSLDKAFKDGELLPGSKKRGEVGFVVPKSAGGLKFVYKFKVFGGTSAVFKVK